MSRFLGLRAWLGGLGDQAWVVFPYGNAPLWAPWYVCTGLSLPLGSGVFIRVMDHDDDDDDDESCKMIAYRAVNVLNPWFAQFFQPSVVTLTCLCTSYDFIRSLVR